MNSNGFASAGAPGSENSKASGPFDVTFPTIVPAFSICNAIASAAVSIVPARSTAGLPAGAAFQVNVDSAVISSVIANVTYFDCDDCDDFDYDYGCDCENVISNISCVCLCYHLVTIFVYFYYGYDYVCACDSAFYYDCDYFFSYHDCDSASCDHDPYLCSSLRPCLLIVLCFGHAWTF